MNLTTQEAQVACFRNKEPFTSESRQHVSVWEKA
jgi:hypothetical protein